MNINQHKKFIGMMANLNDDDGDDCGDDDDGDDD